MLLQLRTYAAAGKLKAVGIIFIVLDILAAIALVTMAILEARKVPFPAAKLTSVYFLPAHSNQGDTDLAYDPFLWMVLAPLEVGTLVANLILAFIVYRDRKKDHGQVPKLMTVILRDNICYLSA